MNLLKNEKGFTLIELVLIIVVLGILAAVAVPQFINLKQDAEASANMAYIGALRSAISIQYASQLLCRDTSPDVQEGTPDCNPTSNGAPTTTAANIESLIDGGGRPGSLSLTAGACGTGKWVGDARATDGTITSVTWTLTCPTAGTRGPLTIASSPTGF
ncbi:MAG: prepilin-type N-terminal cleavage/methylation domain-containing protein [Nitrospirota bacterium]